MILSNLGKLIATYSMVKIKGKPLIEIQSLASKHIQKKLLDKNYQCNKRHGRTDHTK